MGTAETPALPISGLILPPLMTLRIFAVTSPPIRTEAESTQSEYDDFKRVERKERSTDCLRSDDRTEQNRNDIAKLVACGFGESFGNEALFEQVAEHKHTEKRERVRKKQSRDKRNRDRENDFLAFGYGTKLLHSDKTLFFRRQKLHDRRLNNRDKRHIRIRRNRDCRQKIRSEFLGNVNSHRTVRSADNADCRGGTSVKTEKDRADESDEHAKLSTRRR